MSDFVDLRARQFKVGGGTSAPTSGAWTVGDTYWNESPAAGEPTMWVCTAAGTPGTWIPVAPINSQAATVVAAASNITPATALIDIDTGGFNLTLTAPSIVHGGSTIAMMNNTASPVTLVAGAGVTVNAGSAVISANTSAQVRAVYPGNYYRIA
jgi:hypothetical protein